VHGPSGGLLICGFGLLPLGESTAASDMATKTDQEIVIAALEKSRINKQTLDYFYQEFMSLSLVKRLELAKKLDTQQITKLDNVLADFIQQRQQHQNNKLRSGKILHLVRGEHRVLSDGEPMPLEYVVDGDVRKGGTANVRRVKISGSEYALKSFDDKMTREMVEQEVAVVRHLHHTHMTTIFGTIETSERRFHTILSPWCEVSTSPRSM
jgi:hypothetical protein